MRVKPLPPTQRENRRYMFFSYECSGQVNSSDFKRAVRESARTLFGDAGSAPVHIHVIRFENDWGAVRCNSNHVSHARACMASISRVGGEIFACHVINTSGTLNRGIERFISKKDGINGELEREIVNFGHQVGLKVAADNIAVDQFPERDELPNGPSSDMVGRTIFDASGSD